MFQSKIAMFPFLSNPILKSITTHLTLFSVLYLVFYIIDKDFLPPNITTLMNWDAIWYNEIKVYGYTYIPDAQNSTAFFPLFPLMWKLLHLNPVGISIINLLFFYISYYFLARHLDFSFNSSLLYLTNPLLIFCWLPYSESIFFLGSTLLLIGLNKNKKVMIVSGLFLTSLSRSVGIIFIPAMIISTLLTISSKWWRVEVWRRTFIYVLIIVFSSFAVFCVQYLYTGEWFAFFEAQKAWKRELRLPTLPFSSLSGPQVFWLDILALFVVIISTIEILKIIYRYSNRLVNDPILQPIFIFSFSYIVFIGGTTIFFSGVWEENPGTLLMSLNRFIFTTPFFICVIEYFRRQTKNTNSILMGIAGFIISVLLYGGYKTSNYHENYLRTLVYIINIALYFVLCLLSTKKTFLFFVLIVNIVFQIILFNRFLHGFWVG